MTEAVADAFLGEFSTNCTDGRIKPPSMDEPVIGGVVIVEDPSTGQPVPITVAMATDVESFHDTKLPVTGFFDPGRNLVMVAPAVGACRTPGSWRNVLLSVIRHELTHALDPGLYRANLKSKRWREQFIKWLERVEYLRVHAPRGVPVSTLTKMVPGLPDPKELPSEERAWGRAAIKAIQSGREIPDRGTITAGRDMCSYIQDPYEARAFLAQIGSELKLAEGRIPANHPGFRSPDQALRALSPTFDILDETTKDGKKCLLPKDRRRILRMAARTWDAGFLPKRKK